MRSIDKINEDLMPIACFSVRLHIARYSERSSQIVFSGKDSKHTVAVIVVAKFGNQEVFAFYGIGQCAVISLPFTASDSAQSSITDWNPSFCAIDSCF